MATPQPLLEKGIVSPVAVLPALFNRAKYMDDLTAYIGVLEDEYTKLFEDLGEYQEEVHTKAQGIQGAILRMEIKISMLTKKLGDIKALVEDETKSPEKIVEEIIAILG